MERLVQLQLHGLASNGSEGSAGLHFFVELWQIRIFWIFTYQFIKNHRVITA